MTAQVNGELAAKIGSLENLVKGRSPVAESAGTILLVATDSVRPGAHQPRKTFNKLTIEELATSIKKEGIHTPLIVRSSGTGHYELIAGERRWRAAQKAGLRRVPVMVRDLDEAQARQLALVDNIQREDLCLADQVAAISRLVAEMGSARKVAELLGKSEQWVSKLNILAKSEHPVVIDFLASGRSGDADGLLELHRAAERDEEGAKEAAASFKEGSSLRNHLKRVLPKAGQAAEKGRASKTVPESNSRGGRSETLLVSAVSVEGGGVVRFATAGEPLVLKFTSEALAGLAKATSQLKNGRSRMREPVASKGKRRRSGK